MVSLDDSYISYCNVNPEKSNIQMNELIFFFLTGWALNMQQTVEKEFEWTGMYFDIKLFI